MFDAEPMEPAVPDEWRRVWGDEDDMSLRPRPGESASDVVERVTRAAREAYDPEPPDEEDA